MLRQKLETKQGIHNLWTWLYLKWCLKPAAVENQVEIEERVGFLNLNLGDLCQWSSIGKINREGENFSRPEFSSSSYCTYFKPIGKLHFSSFFIIFLIQSIVKINREKEKTFSKIVTGLLILLFFHQKNKSKTNKVFSNFAKPWRFAVRFFFYH